MRDTMRPGDHCGGDVMTEAGNDPRATRAFVVRSPRANLLVVVLAAAAIAGCGDRSGAAAPPPLPVVRVASVIEEDVPISLEYVGTLVGYINAQIRARVSGHLMSQNYQEGSPVKAGDPLFQVDPRPFQAALDQAEAKLLQAESQLSQAKAQVSASQAQVEQAVAKVAQDEAQVKRSGADRRRTELDVGRYAPLPLRGAVSQQELDNAVQNNLANLPAVAAARAAVQNSQASVLQARAALERAQADVKTQEPNMAPARAAVADATLNRGHTRGLSPITGVAGVAVVGTGGLAGPHEPKPPTSGSPGRPRPP